MMKDYKNMTQEELEKELAEIVKKNFEKGVLLLDHNFEIKRLKGITGMEDVEDIDEVIAILRAMKNKPDMEKYFLGDTDIVGYALIKIVEEYAVNVLMFQHFSNIDDEIMKMYFTDRLKDLGVVSGKYYIVQLLNYKYIGTLGVLFYNEENKHIVLNYADDNDCETCENAYGSKDIYLDAIRRRLKIKDANSKLHFAADFIMEYLPDDLKSKITKKEIVTILELEADYCELKDIESECACCC